MSLAQGSRIGPYEALSTIGAGGMGEVYRARDTRLNRDVALKILPESFAQDPDRLARFRREAQVLASLNHPNIGAIDGLEDTDGRQALVLELIEGPTLADRVAQGPIPLEEALPIAKQIAEALEAAHDQRIIHRDLKPANIKVRPDGTVKVLDFGLSKALTNDGSSVSGALLTNSPTMTSPVGVTGVGVLLGTAAFMSPEQAAGKPTDRRADLWAFGVVLTEMLTGRPIFVGESVAHVLADILRTQPDLSALPAATPSPLRRLIRRCLEKNPRHRLADASTARLEIEDAINGGLDPVVSVLKQRPSRGVLVGALIIAMIAVVVLAVAVSQRRTSTNASGPTISFNVEPPAESLFVQQPGALNNAISPDGSKLVFRVLNHDIVLFAVRHLNRPDARVLEGTEGGANPIWSSDSVKLAFTQDGRTRVIDTDTGAVSTIAQQTCGSGGVWNGQFILCAASSGGGLMRMSAADGTVTQVTNVNRETGETIHSQPEFLPDGRHFLYVSQYPTRVFVGNLDGGVPKHVMDGDTKAVYSEGHVLFARNGTLFAQPFDVDRLEVSGAPFRIIEGVRFNAGNAAVAVSVSNTGILTVGIAASQNPLAWMDRAGREQSRPIASGIASYPVVSPDGKWFAVAQSTPDRGLRSDVVVYNIERENSLRLVTGFENLLRLAWTRDLQVAFSNRSTRPNATAGDKIVLASVDGSPSDTITTGTDVFDVLDWSRDGQSVLYTRVSPETGTDIWAWRREGQAFPVVQSTQADRSGFFSPDGQWIVYESEEGGRSEVFVQRFPPAGSRVQVSTAGGRYPRWRPNGRELFYTRPDGMMMAVAVTLGETVRFDTPKPLFKTSVGFQVTSAGLGDYAVSADGERFLVAMPDSSASSRLTVILNWPTLARR